MVGSSTRSICPTRVEVPSAFVRLNVTLSMPPLVVSSQRSLVLLEALVRAR